MKRHLGGPNRIAAAVLVLVALVAGGLVAVFGGKPATSVQRLLGNGILIADANPAWATSSDPQVGVLYVTPSGTPDARAYVAGDTVEVTQRPGATVVQADTGADRAFYGVDQRTMKPSKLALSKAEGRVSSKVVAVGTAPDVAYYYIRLAGTPYVRLVPPLGGAKVPKVRVRDGIAQAVGGADGTLVTVGRSSGQASVFVDGRLARTVTVGGSGSADRIRATVVDGKPVVVSPALGSLVVFSEGRVERRISVGQSQGLRVADFYESSALVAIVDTTEGPRLVSIDVATGRQSTIDTQDAQITDATAPPLVTPGHIFLYERNDAGDPDPTTLRAVDPATGNVENAALDGYANDRAAGDAPPVIELAGGRVIVNDPNGDNAWVVFRPGADGTVEVNKRAQDIDNINEPPKSPPPPPPPGDGNNGNGSANRVTIRLPGVPGAFTATARAAAVGLAWTAPDAGGGSIQEYEISVACVANCDRAERGPGRTVRAPGGALGWDIGELNNGSEYQFTVRARNEVGFGPATGPVSATPSGDVAYPPNDVTSIDQHDANVKVSWAASPRNSSAGFKGTVTGYSLYGWVRGALKPCGITVDASTLEATVPSGRCWGFDSDAAPDVAFKVATLGSVTDSRTGTTTVVESGPSDPSPAIDPYRTLNRFSELQPTVSATVDLAKSALAANVVVTAPRAVDRPIEYSDDRNLSVSGPGTFPWSIGSPAPNPLPIVTITIKYASAPSDAANVSAQVATASIKPTLNSPTWSWTKDSVRLTSAGITLDKAAPYATCTVTVNGVSNGSQPCANAVDITAGSLPLGTTTIAWSLQVVQAGVTVGSNSDTRSRSNVRHYDHAGGCANCGTYLANGGADWSFVATGSYATSGHVTLGADVPRAATIGIYTSPGRSGQIWSISVNVNGYGGVDLPIGMLWLTKGQTYYLGITSPNAQGFTWYRSGDGFLWGYIDGLE